MPRKHLLSSVDVAELLGWTRVRAQRWMEREEVGFKIGSRWYTTPTKLRDAFPEVYAELVPELVEDKA